MFIQNHTKDCNEVQGLLDNREWAPTKMSVKRVIKGRNYTGDFTARQLRTCTKFSSAIFARYVHIVKRCSNILKVKIGLKPSLLSCDKSPETDVNLALYTTIKTK